MISQDVLMFKVFMDFIDKDFIPCAAKVYQKFGPIKQIKKLAEEHDEYFDCNERYKEAIDFLFVAIQVYGAFHNRSFKTMLGHHPFKKKEKYDLKMCDFITSLSAITKGEELFGAEEIIMDLIYAIFCEERNRALFLNSESCMEHMKKIVYHCSRLVKYEFKE